MENSTKKAVAYLRAGGITEDKQYESINAQMNVIDEFAKKNNIEVVMVVDTMGNENPKFKLAELYDHCQNNPDIKYVLVSSFGRINRKTETYFYWKKLLSDLDVEIKSARESIGNQSNELFLEAVFVALAKSESKNRAELVKDKMRRKAEAGYLMYAPPIGYQRTKIKGLYRPNKFGKAISELLPHLVDSLEPETFRNALMTAYEGQYKRVPTKIELRRWISNPYYGGFVKYDGKTYKGLHKALFTPEVQKRLLKALG